MNPWVLVHSVIEPADARAVQELLAKMPEGATGEFDPELQVVVIHVTASAEVVNDAHSVLSGSGLVYGGPIDDRAVRRYWPERASRPAYWDELGEDWDICTTCGWSTRSFDTPEGLEAEKRRHEVDVHHRASRRG